jgi:hypothetical protein
MVRLIAVAIKMADKPIEVSFQAALDTPPGKIDAVLMPTRGMIPKSGIWFSLGTNAKRLPGDHAQAKR